MHFSLIAVKEKCVVDPRNKEDIEIVMNELQKLRMMADFLQNSSRIISRCPGV